MLPELESYDWSEAFHYADSPCVSECNKKCLKKHVHPVIFSKVSATGFSREDVDIILSMVLGVPDEDSWVGVFKLKDGRFASLEAGCDYTGWD
jgi:hypothetical protein